MKGVGRPNVVVAMLPAVRRSFGVGLVVLGLVILIGGRVAARRQAPPPAAPATSATGAISGVVMDGATGKPIGGATVSFWSLDSTDPRSYQQGMLTDAKGRFVFLGLPATDGCNIYVSKSGYADGGLAGSFSSLTPALPLKPGEWVPNVTLTLWRNGGISGRVVDESNEPVVGTPVRALRLILVAGMPHVAAGPIATTDDRGIYRINSLPAGKYLVMVPSVQSSAPASTSALTLAGRRTDAPNPNDRPPINDVGLNIGGDRLVIGNYVTPPPASARLMAYPTMFYPGVRLLTSATPIDLAPGEEKGGVDFALQPLPAVRVSGTVISSGALDPNFVLRLLPRGSEGLGVGGEQATALVSASGTFTFLGVPSGSYTIDAGLNVNRYGAAAGWGPLTPGMLRVTWGGASAPSAPDGVSLAIQRKDVVDREWAELPIDVGADDVTGLRITLRPSITVSGEVVWDGPAGSYTTATGQTYPALPSIQLEPAAGDPHLFPTFTGLGGPPARQRFSLTGLRAGEYVIRPAAHPGTTVVRVVANGQDVTTGTIDTSSGDITGVIVTMTTKGTRISGSVRDVTGSGQQASVIAFPVEKRQWSRYGLTPLTIKTTKFLGPRYTLTGLPPGEYFVIAVDAASGGAWRDPAWLDAASRVATRVTLRWEEPVTVDLSLSRVQVK